MKRLMVFAAVVVGVIGLLAEPAVAGTLKRFSVADQGVVSAGDATVRGKLQCANVGSYFVSTLVTQGTITGSGKTEVPCTGSKELWSTPLSDDGPFVAGKARVCAIAEEAGVGPFGTRRVRKQICKTVTLVEEI